jgi:hypothetical protein
MQSLIDEAAGLDFDEQTVAALGTARDVLRERATPSAPLPEAGEGLPELPEASAYEFQHDETGRKTIVAHDGINDALTFGKLNPRYSHVADLYTAEQMRAYALAARTPQPAAPNEAEDAAEAMRIVGIVAAGTISIVNMRDAQALVERAAMRGESRG